MSTIPSTDPGGTGGPSNVLLLAGRRDEREATACGELAGPTAPQRAHLLLVTGIASPWDRLTSWADAVGGRPPETTVVDVSTTTRSAVTADPAAVSVAGPTDWSDVTIETVDDDLLTLGQRVTNVLSGTDRQPVVCVDSVSDLLQSTNRECVFRFLEVLTRDVERSGAVAHYHLDPDIHDPETVSTVEVLFDAVLDLREDGHAH
jgi:hypothetical protein